MIWVLLGCVLPSNRPGSASPSQPARARLRLGMPGVLDCPLSVHPSTPLRLPRGALGEVLCRIKEVMRDAIRRHLMRGSFDRELAELFFRDPRIPFLCFFPFPVAQHPRCLLQPRLLSRTIFWCPALPPHF